MWHETRKLVASGLREMGLSTNWLEEHIQEEARMLIDRLEVQPQPLYPRTVLLKATSNVLQRICFGDRYVTSRSKSSGEVQFSSVQQTRLILCITIEIHSHDIV